MILPRSVYTGLGRGELVGEMGPWASELGTQAQGVGLFLLHSWSLSVNTKGFGLCSRRCCSLPCLLPSSAPAFHGFATYMKSRQSVLSYLQTLLLRGVKCCCWAGKSKGCDFLSALRSPDSCSS